MIRKLLTLALIAQLSYVVAGCVAENKAVVRGDAEETSQLDTVTESVSDEKSQAEAVVQPERSLQSAPAVALVQTETPAPPAVTPAPVVTTPEPVVTVREPPASAPAPQPQVRAAAPQAAGTVTADRTPRTFKVTAEDKNASHPNFGRGAPIGLVVDGVQGKELVLTRGVAYMFDVDTGVQHDFYFTTSPAGWGTGAWTDGVANQFIFKGEVSFNPSQTAPDTLYYQCRNHKYMGGKINVANAGDKVAISGGGDGSAVVEETRRTVSAAEVTQKINYADMLINTSSSSKRVAGSDNAEAKELAVQARSKLDAARNASDAGDLARAMDEVDEAVRLMNSATRLVPDKAAAVELQARYKELHEHVNAFEKSYQQNLKRVKGAKGTLDEGKLHDLVSQAEALAAKGQHAEANKLLTEADGMISVALGSLLNAQTMVYDLSFATPQEEYEYELARFNSYAELIPIAKEQRQPAASVIDMIDELTKKGSEIHDEGVALAAKGDYKSAIMAMQGATDRMQKALRLMGVQ